MPSHYLTYWGQGKMAALLETTFSNSIWSMKKCEFLIKFCWTLSLVVQLTIIKQMYQIMAWHQTGDKPLFETVMAWFADAYMCYLASVSWKNADCWLIIIWTPSNDELQWNFNQITVSLQVSCKKMHLKIMSWKYQLFCSGLSVLTHWGLVTPFGDIDLGQLGLQ